MKRPLRDYLQAMDRDLSPAALAHFGEHCLFSSQDLTFLVEQAGFSICEVVGRRTGCFALVVAEPTT